MCYLFKEQHYREENLSVKKITVLWKNVYTLCSKAGLLLFKAHPKFFLKRPSVVQRHVPQLPSQLYLLLALSSGKTRNQLGQVWRVRRLTNKWNAMLPQNVFSNYQRRLTTKLSWKKRQKSFVSNIKILRRFCCEPQNALVNRGVSRHRQYPSHRL